MRKMILATAIGVMVFAGAAVAVAQTEDGAETPVGRLGGAIEDVLDGLVSDGTLDQEQADAVMSALEDRHATWHEDRRAVREAMEEAWSDGVLTEEELSLLPNGGSGLTNPDGPLAEYWDDGQLTREELDEARANGDIGFGRGWGRGFRHGFGGEPDAGPGSGFGGKDAPDSPGSTTTVPEADDTSI